MTTYQDRRQFAELVALIGTRPLFLIRTEDGQFILRKKVFDGSFTEARDFLSVDREDETIPLPPFAACKTREKRTAVP
jgi:hypothetical protein